MLSFIFYVWAILALAYEGWKLSYYNYKQLRSLETLVKSSRGLKGNVFWAQFTEDQKTFLVLTILYCLWAFIGLFTSQWFLFLMIMLLSQIQRMFKSYFYTVIDSAATIFILLSIILNKYHLHYSFTEVFNYFWK